MVGKLSVIGVASATSTGLRTKSERSYPLTAEGAMEHGPDRVH